MLRKRVVPLWLCLLFGTTLAKPQEKASITLEELVQASLNRNRDVLALRQRVAQAQGLRRQAGVLPAPTLEAEGTSARPLGGSGEEEFSAAFVQPIETFGKRTNRVRVAEVSIALAEAELDERSTQIAYEIETGYLSVVYERERIAVLDRVSGSLRESQRLTEARVREGDAAPLEAQLLAVELSRGDAQRADAAGRLAAAELQLRRLAALGPSDPLPTIGPSTGGRAALSLEQLSARAQEKRADLHIARLLEQQGDAEVALTTSQGRPDVTLSARFAYNNMRLEGQYGFTSARALTPLREQYNSLSVGVSVPLLTQRRNQGTVEAAAAGAAGARLHREHLAATIPLEVETAYQRWTAAMRTRDLLRDGVIGQSNKNLAVVREAYQLGQLRLLDVLNEQRRMTEYEMAYLDARLEAARTLAELERVTGGLLQ
jgi:cobalt-zinc-cadmium efflux system outer membrane protein